MSKENAETVRGVYDEWSRGNLRASLELMDPLVLFVVPPEFPDTGTYLGVDRLRHYTRGFLEAWTRIKIEAEEITDAGDSVVAAVRQSGAGGESGAVTELRYLHVWTFRGDKVIRLELFREREDAFSAVRAIGRWPRPS